MVRLNTSSACVEASIAMDQARALDRAMAWLALYVPTVGTSVMLHVALVLLALVLIPFGAEQPPEFEAVGTRIVPPDRKYEAEARDGHRPAYSRDLLEPQTRCSIKRAKLAMPGFGKNPLAAVDGVIGVGSSRVGGGPPGFFPDDGPPGMFEPPDGRSRETSVVYLVDRSGSMTDSIDYVKYELKARIAELGEACAFHVIFFSSGPPVEMPTRRLVPATERNKRLALEFIDKVVAGGETDPSDAFDRAFAVGPRIVYFLTDGEFDKAVIDQVGRLNAGGEVIVHTIGFLYRPNEEALRAIAAANGGRYTFVSDADLARLGT